MKRRLPMVPACLIAGLAINILVAWGVAAWAPLPAAATFQKLKEGPLDRVWMRPPDWPAPNVIARRTAIGRENWQFNYFADVSGSAQVTGDYATHLFRVGWPFLTLENSTGYRDGAGPLADYWGQRTLVFPDRVRPAWTFRMGREYATYIPTRPMWMGIVFNTIIYATLVGSSILLLGHLRRVRRRRRVLCVRCGYPVSGIAMCPECGTPVRHFATTLPDAAAPTL